MLTQSNMLYQIRHKSRFRYDSDVLVCQNLTHLKARTLDSQTCIGSRLEVSLPPAVRMEYLDYFGNSSCYFSIQENHRALDVIATNEVLVRPAPAPDPAQSESWNIVRDNLRLSLAPEIVDALQFAYDSPYVKTDAELLAFAKPSFPEGRPILEAALDLTGRIFRGFTFDPAATTTATPLHDVLKLRRGVCQDFAHLQIGCLRAVGLASRYVSGYIETTPPPGKARLVGADASHAWTSVYCPPYGWVDLDPTNNAIPSGKHITLAWGRDYDDVSPIKGVILGGGYHSISVEVDVVRLPEDVRPTPTETFESIS